jgi:hypothetical protein
MYDYNEFIQRALQSTVIDTTYDARIENIVKLAPKASPIEGDRITEKFKAAKSSNAAAYTKADADPASDTNTLIKPYWSKVFYHDAVEVHNIDISNSADNGMSLVSDAIADGTKSLMAIVKPAMLAQLLADIDSSGTAYSDASLSRSTYATLASYEDTTNATITVDYMQGMIRGVALNKQVGPRSGYTILCEDGTFNTFSELAQALHVWNFVAPPAGAVLPMGYQAMGSFEGVDIQSDPDMTTGSLFMIRREDLRLTVHRPLTWSQVPSGADTVKFVGRVGINLHVVNPGFQGKMLDKD